MSSPGHEFSRQLEQSFAWPPPDLSVSSHSCPSIVALSPSEIAQLGLRHSESTSTSFQSFTNNDIHTPSRTDERIYDLGTRPMPKSAEFGFKRYSMDQATSIDKFGHLQLGRARDNDMLPNAPSSSVLFSSTSHDLSFQSSTEDNSRPHAVSQRQISSNSYITPREAVRYRPRSYPGLANDDAPSALDFHINTFPSLLALDVQPLPVAARQDRADEVHPYPYTLPHSQSFSPLSTLSDRSDIHRQLIHFASPTFSLSQFPSSLSSPAFGSSEISGDATAYLPADLGTGDIIIDMTPISDENSISIHQARQMVNARRTQEGGQSKRITEKIANCGGKFKRALLKRIQGLRMQNNTRLSKTENDDYSSSIVDEPQLSAPDTPPGLAALLVSGVDSAIRTTTIQETKLPLISRAIPQNESQPSNSTRKKFSLSLFARPSIIFSSEIRRRRQARPKSMSDLSNQYPTRSTLVGSCGSDNPDIMPVLTSTARKRSKKLSLLFLKKS
ncbi:hypothetical protein APHAL10511_006339 [Amanita phalloides]|nr:hypothetical protein APHAL10511_006339 [Amanita phalloides]